MLLRFALVSAALLLRCATATAVSSADTLRLRQHLVYLTTTPQPRNHQHVAVLDTVAAYLGRQLRQAGARVTEQPYEVNGKIYRNVIGSFGPETGPRLIVGAHYDVCDNQPGADDNGTGTAALLELARLLGQQTQLPQRIDLVAYTLEEPPYFRTPHMGSYVHAKSLHDQNVAVTGMVVLEMLGYYDDRRGSQKYPFAPLKLVYGGRGNYVTAVRKLAGGRFARRFSRHYDQAAALPVKRFIGPAWLPGIDFSDHLSYWHFGYSALMLTDTAFYRNRNYHHATDTLEKLDLRRLALAVDAVLAALLAV
ncbi:M28 family peptidase [Hymenobacter busanensis]|uniref:M28 family peptidase n=1 Tax=Hymenobacter busanensis TaxID=2607656 RepID=A0A7L4ZTT5_9BACT|nr:M28 family peptidase [Hymenobacter busanensis]KAA9339697.1 M28 family peptidase [Hymenobacter busanensis]QHJ06548.1 M28 family peptidase [Hymenobacter busanensis]